MASSDETATVPGTEDEFTNNWQTSSSTGVVQVRNVVTAD